VTGSRDVRARLTVVAVAALAVIACALAVLSAGRANQAGPPPAPSARTGLPATPGSYLGVYSPASPSSYAGVTSFATATGVRPRLVVYYSGWSEPFQADFAASAARHGSVPMVQIDPTDVSLTAIAAGRYDAYLGQYARAVRAYHHPVILSFGHEMNAPWYSWGYLHTSPAAFVAAWRHIVTVFRALGARNVTWLWTVNVIQSQDGRTLRPAPWWPGNSYVTWVGVDGYYLKPSWQFAAIFGPTIVALRELTRDPILIAETSVTHAADQPDKIADLFAGIHAYGLLGFVWFNAVTSHDYRIASPEATTVFRREARAFGS
jgi:mannan endo-1,4-beta-mannosidase